MDGPLRNKSFAFALRVVKLSQYLREDKREYVLGQCKKIMIQQIAYSSIG